MMRAARLCFVVVVAYAPVALADTVVNWNIASMSVLFSSRQQAGLSLEDWA